MAKTHFNSNWFRFLSLSLLMLPPPPPLPLPFSQFYFRQYGAISSSSKVVVFRRRRSRTRLRLQTVWTHRDALHTCENDKTQHTHRYTMGQQQQIYCLRMGRKANNVYASNEKRWRDNRKYAAKMFISICVCVFWCGDAGTSKFSFHMLYSVNN